jgi:hypothetical protein
MEASMSPRVRARVTADVKKALEMLASDPKLVLALHRVLARLYKKANVDLTPAEKAGLFKEIGASIGVIKQLVKI